MTRTYLNKIYRLIPVPTLLFLTLCGLASCTSPPDKKRARLNISFHSQPQTLDPRKSGDFISSTLICMLYEGLTRSKEGSVETALASSYELSKDQKTYLFHLRSAYWSDGKPITAYDFETSWKKIVYPPNMCAFLFYPIKNGEKCAKGELPLSDLGVFAIDEKTLQVELEHPTPYFYSLTASPSFLPFPSHIKCEENQEVHSGPFTIQKFVRNSEIILAKNPHYWNSKKISIDEIHISIIPDEMTALQMFERSELDWLGGTLSPLPPDALETLSKKYPLHFMPIAATTVCTFNTQTPPFNNIHLRKAFSLAIDREKIVYEMAQLGQIPASRFLPPSLIGKDKKLIPFTNQEIAREELHQALEEISLLDLDSLTLYFKEGQIEKRVAQTLQKQWKEVLGMNIQLQQMDAKSHLQTLQQRDYQVALSSWIAHFQDPVSILDRFKTPLNLKNYPGWEDETFSKLLEQAANTNQENRVEILERAEKLLAHEMPLTPIYHWSYPILLSPKIRSIETTPCGGILFERFQLQTNGS